MQSQVIDGRARVQASRIRLLGIHFHTAVPEASSSVATDPAWQASCSVIVIVTVIIITNWPVSICPSWCMNPLLTSTCHLSLRRTCSLVMLREEWYNSRGSGGEAFSGHQMYLLSILIVPLWIMVLAKELLIASKDAFQFQEELEFNKRNRCVKFSQHRGLFCYSAATSQVLKPGWLTISVGEVMNQLLSSQCVLQTILSLTIYQFLNGPKLTPNTKYLSDWGYQIKHSV